MSCLWKMMVKRNYIILILFIIVFIIGSVLGCIITLFVTQPDYNFVYYEPIKIYNLKEEQPVVNIEEDVVYTKNEPICLGEFKLTAYCPCEKCCGSWAFDRPDGIVYGSSGEELKAGYSIAVDPSVIPYGTEVVINGVTYRADDCGGAINGNRIDVYFNNHKDALDFGVKYADVFMEVE